MVPTVTKQVCIAYGLVDLEEELEQASHLLEVVRDEAVVVMEQVQAVDACLRDLDDGVVRECGGSSRQTCNHKHKQLYCIANYEDILLQLATTVDSNPTQTQDSSPEDREPSMIPLKKLIDLREPKRCLG